MSKFNDATEALDFVRRVFELFNIFDGADKDNLFWRVDDKYAPVSFFVNCNDVFWWGTADAEDLAPDNIGECERALKDCKEVDPVCGSLMTTLLFACRVRKMRPQGAYYKHIEEKYWHLFDACGPVREVDGGNPRHHPLEVKATSPVAEK